MALTPPVSGCAALLTDAQAQVAADALTYSAVALRMLNAVAEKHIDSLDLPTPEQLEQAASIVRDLRSARHELELAEHDMRNDEVEYARAHARDAVVYMQGATDTLKQLGADVSAVQTALNFASRFL